jgi:hypothetical protein
VNRRPVWPAFLLACLAGCASYQYQLLQPAADAGRVPAGGQRRFDIDPLRYAVGVAEDRLSIQVENPTADTLRLIGADSFVVDPAGQSHPLIDQTIAPQSFVRIVLPPLRPVGGATYPQADPSAGGGEPNPAYDRASPVYWSWPSVGSVRVHLAYRRDGGGSLTHDLTFDRQRT